MNQILAAIIVALALALGGVGFLYKRQTVRVGSLEEQNKTLVAGAKQAAAALKRNHATLLAKERDIALQARKTREAQQALHTALQGEKDWNDTEVPTSVQKALLGNPSDPVSGPASLNGVFRNDSPNP